MNDLPRIARTQTSREIQSMIDKSRLLKLTTHTRRFKTLNTNIQRNQKKFFKIFGAVVLILAILGIFKFLLSVGSIGFSLSLYDLSTRSVLYMILHSLILGFFMMIYFIIGIGITRKKLHTLYYSHILFMTALLILVLNIITIFIGNSFLIYNGRGALLDLILAYFIMIIIIQNKEYFDK